jgi:hypothetical protein
MNTRHYSPFLQLTPLITVIQEFILRVEVGEYGRVMGVEPATNAWVVLWFGQEEGGVVGACYQSPTGGDRLLLHEQPNHRAVRTHVHAVAGLRGHHRTVVLKEGLGGIRELLGVINLKTHVHIVKLPQNHESGLRFHF